MKPRLITAGTVLAALVATGSLVAQGQASSVAHRGHEHGQAPDAAEAAAMVAQQRLAPVRGSEFRAECTAGSRAGNDPIVFPNQTGTDGNPIQQ